MNKNRWLLFCVWVLGIWLLVACKSPNVVLPATPSKTLVPSATPVPSSTLTSLPTNTPKPTNTSRPTGTPVPTATPVNFAEEFTNSTLDESIWVHVGPPIEIKTGVLYLKSNQATAPYLYTKRNIFPTEGNYVIEISFRYSNVTRWGAGLVIGKVIPSPGNGPSSADIQNAFLSIYQDGGDWPLAVCFGGNRVFASPGSNLMQHIVELRYDGQYDLLVDGKLLYTSPPLDDRPTSLWIGQPANIGGPSEWTSLEIDYIRVKSTP